MNFDDLTLAEKKSISYNTITGSIEYVAEMFLGETDQSTYALGRGSMNVILHLVFWVAAFIIMIHLMNMLIAIMGNTFDIAN